MTTTLPRPIAREDIRVGDRVRAEWTAYRVETSEVGTVASIDGDGVPLTADDGRIGIVRGYATVEVTYTLLDRPGPALPTEPGEVILVSRLGGVDPTGRVIDSVDPYESHQRVGHDALAVTRESGHVYVVEIPEGGTYEIREMEETTSE